MASEFTSFICLKGRVQQNFRGCCGIMYLMRRTAFPVLFPFLTPQCQESHLAQQEQVWDPGTFKGWFE